MSEIDELFKIVKVSSYATSDCCGEESRELVCDAEEVEALLESVDAQLAKLTEQNAKLVEMLELALDAACEPYSCGEDFCERVSELLTEIKEQK